MRISWTLFLFPLLLSAGEITGVVVDARGGEALARVRVQLTGTEFQTVTDSQGRFSFARVPAGDYVLHVETVGYRLVKQPFSLSSEDVKDFQVILSPDTFRRVDSVDVRADPFEYVQAATPTELNLSDAEIKNLGSVLVDDPIRAVQSLPGVKSNNDYYSQFTIYGAPYSAIGFYLDDVLMHAPWHTIQGIRDSGSISILNGDSIESLSLMPIAFPSRFMDRTGAALDVRTREGSRTRPSFRASASVAQAHLLGEGPLTPSRRGSWLLSFRKSYAQYIARKITDDPAQAVAFTDGMARLTYDLTSRQQGTLQVFTGVTDYDRSQSKARWGVNTLFYAYYRPLLARAGWQYTKSAKMLISANAAYLRETYDNSNRDRAPLGGGYYGEWTGAGRVTWYWGADAPLEAGWTSRRIRAEGFDNQYIGTSANVRVRDRHNGTALRQGGYVQQSWTAPGKKARLSLGMRWDTHNKVGPDAISPHASLSVAVTRTTQAQFGWGQYVQFPEVSVFSSPYGGLRLLPERANHLVANIEQRLSRTIRVRVEAYQRESRDRIARPYIDPRWVAGRLVGAQANALYFNSVRGYSRGVQILVHSRSANKVSGWASYTLGYARNRDGVDGSHYPDENDQRHTAGVYLSYRFTPSWSLGGKYAYGSGDPVPGFFRRDAAGVYYLTDQRNGTRLAAYQRVDFRLNKSFVFDRWKLTFYGELINATNHYNPRFVSFDSVDSRTGRALLTIQRVFPILPSGGIMLEF